MSAIHGANQVHRDVKPDNILVKSIDPDPELGPRIKLIDFGFASDVPGETLKVTVGAPLCKAPELVRKEEHGQPVDIWAVGVMAYYLLSY